MSETDDDMPELIDSTNWRSQCEIEMAEIAAKMAYQVIHGDPTNHKWANLSKEERVELIESWRSSGFLVKLSDAELRYCLTLVGLMDSGYDHSAGGNNEQTETPKTETESTPFNLNR
ncbi:hypothetical protein BDR26DRAFT_898805 [Obelidium mucronatum]|nr:hypothetical protein BDR26DRAFT_898805 [Obelidium mucronatum]